MSRSGSMTCAWRGTYSLFRIRKEHRRWQMASGLRFLVKDEEVNRAEAIEYPVLVAGSIVPEKDSVAVFESDKEFAEWARGTKYKAKVAETLRLISEFPRVGVDDQGEARRFQAATHQMTRNL